MAGSTKSSPYAATKLSALSRCKDWLMRQWW